MGWINILKQSLGFSGTTGTPPPASSRDFYTPSSHTVDAHELHFTRNAIAKMGQWALSEADVKDVFYHGGVIVKQNMMMKKYNGYEIGLYYFQDRRTGQYIITSAWKRDRY